MEEAPAFEWTAGELESATSLSKVASRGIVRLALRRCGLESHRVSQKDMLVVLRTVMPNELQVRGIRDAEALCETVRLRLSAAALEDVKPKETAEDIFRRMLG